MEEAPQNLKYRKQLMLQIITLLYIKSFTVNAQNVDI